MNKITFEKTTYSNGQDEFPAVYVKWPEVERFLGEPHEGDFEQDERIVTGLLDAGAPRWIKNALGWVDENGWGLYGPKE